MDTNLYYYRARYYDSFIGRFISEDPLGFGAGVNFYTYVNNDPINNNDPSGLVDVIYSAGPLNQYNPIYANPQQPGKNYQVADSYGATVPMGSGVYNRTVTGGKPISSVVGATATINLVEAGRSHILTNRLNGASGDASLREVRIQSGEGQPWDTKHSLSSTSAYIINGKAELNDYVGNTTWAAGLNALGVGEFTRNR